MTVTRRRVVIAFLGLAATGGLAGAIGLTGGERQEGPADPDPRRSAELTLRVHGMT